METIKKRAILPPPFIPYSYQKPIIKLVMDRILENKNGLVIQPTATGKSTEAAFVARNCILLHKMKGLYLYDETEGLLQARQSFEYIFNGNDIHCINFFGNNKSYDLEKADIVFASFQSLNNQYEKWYQMLEQDHFDFIIVNEAHHGQAFTYREVIDYFSCPKIGMTATPERMDGRDILEIFDEVLFEMPLEEALVLGYISSIEYHLCSHNLSTTKLKEMAKEILEEGKRISIKQLNETIFVEALDEVVLNEIYKYAFPKNEENRQVLIFCENILHAKHVHNLIIKDNHSVDLVHSQRTKNQNNEALTNYRKNKIQFLISVDKLNEDIDVPNVEVGVFLRATNSLTIFLQQLGRLLRKTKTKNKAIILDFVANAERLVIVRELMKKIETITEKLLKQNQILPLQKDVLHLNGDNFSFSITDTIVNVIELIDAIKTGFYDTWQEASAICIASGVRSKEDYRKRYKSISSRLYSTPNQLYKDFPGWDIFLDKYFQTWQEASAVCIANEVESSIDYRERYKSINPKLCSVPSRTYKDFPGWKVFLDKYFQTWQEASAVCIANGVKGFDDYHKRYKSINPKLPSDIERFYKDFPGWIVFLEKKTKEYFQTWQEASAICIASGVRSKEDYRKRYKSISSRLHSNPNRLYKDFPWWTVFLGKK